MIVFQMAITYSMHLDLSNSLFRRFGFQCHRDGHNSFLLYSRPNFERKNLFGMEWNRFAIERRREAVSIGT